LTALANWQIPPDARSGAMDENLSRRRVRLLDQDRVSESVEGLQRYPDLGGERIQQWGFGVAKNCLGEALVPASLRGFGPFGRTIYCGTRRNTSTNSGTSGCLRTHALDRRQSIRPNASSSSGATSRLVTNGRVGAMPGCGAPVGKK